MGGGGMGGGGMGSDSTGGGKMGVSRMGGDERLRRSTRDLLHTRHTAYLMALLRELRKPVPAPSPRLRLRT